ncbi:MAG: tetratricopeptide repeat protein [Caldilineaceae bacterium]|nr:tetratricopeptide repeat protein [Caldilineaceae bacterium]
MWVQTLDERTTAGDLVPLVNDALKNCHSVLALSRSPLANSRIVQPALVRDDASPTAEERSHALFLALRWAATRLAPGPVAHPFGTRRPYDDPTWQDPRWWRYNILRHRYLEPLHPDEFVEGGRFTETLLGLTGISSSDRFYDERTRAVKEAGEWLLRQLHAGDADAELERLALSEVYQPLRSNGPARQLLEIAATFSQVFPRTMLLEMARAEGMPQAESILDDLIRRRYLLSEQGDAGWSQDEELWISPALQRYVYKRVEQNARRTRHARAARLHARAEQPLMAGHHHVQAGQAAEAARLLLAAREQMMERLEVDELRRALATLPSDELPAELAYTLLTALADLHYLAGEHDAAVAACRGALARTKLPLEQARIYRRLGKLYEKRNQSHAITYYRQAVERFGQADPEVAELLKDRGWLHILRRSWAEAERDLTDALARNQGRNRVLEADIYDALSSLQRRLRDYPAALKYGRQSLALREAAGDPARIANSLINLGLIYNDQGDYAHAIAAHEEAGAAYAKLGNREMTLTARLNIGLAHHLDGQLSAAIAVYRKTLEQGMEIGHHLTVVTTHSNLAEAYAELGDAEQARRHWLAGYELSRQHGFDDELNYYVELSQATPALAGLAEEPAPLAVLVPPAADGVTFVPQNLDPAERTAWELVTETGQVTTRALMDAAGVSKPTATRKLAGLATRGLLARQGQGRGTFYTRAHQGDAPAAASPPDGPALGRRLRAVQTELAREYRITGLALVRTDLPPDARAPGSPLLPDAPTVIARFAEMPDVPALFAAQARISRAWGAPLHVIPLAIVGEANAGTWLWE